MFVDEITLLVKVKVVWGCVMARFEKEASIRWGAYVGELLRRAGFRVELNSRYLLDTIIGQGKVVISPDISVDLVDRRVFVEVKCMLAGIYGKPDAYKVVCFWLCSC